MAHTFSTTSPQLSFRLPAPEEGNTLSLAFALHPPAGWKPGAQIRLCHVRLAGVKGLPKHSEVFELKVSANGKLVVELSGYGNKQPEFVEPLKLGAVTAGAYSVTYDPASGGVAVEAPAAAAEGVTHIVSGDRELEVLFGFGLTGKKLTAPIGWTLEWKGESPASWA